MAGRGQPNPSLNPLDPRRAQGAVSQFGLGQAGAPQQGAPQQGAPQQGIPQNMGAWQPTRDELKARILPEAFDPPVLQPTGPVGYGRGYTSLTGADLNRDNPYPDPRLGYLPGGMPLPPRVPYTFAPGAPGPPPEYVRESSHQLHAVLVTGMSREMTEGATRALFNLRGMLRVFAVHMHEEPDPNADRPIIIPTGIRGTGAASRTRAGNRLAATQHTQAATVFFYEPDDAQLAVLHLNNFTWQGCRLQVQISNEQSTSPIPIVQPASTTTPSNVMIEVRFMPYGMREQDLQSLFGDCGEIVWGRCQPECLVEQNGTRHNYFCLSRIQFATEAQAENARRAHNGKLFREKWRLEVKYVTPYVSGREPAELYYEGQRPPPPPGNGKGNGKERQPQRPPVVGA